MHIARLVFLTAVFVAFGFGTVAAQTTAFNYQGSLSTSGSPANGNHDFEFALFDSLAAGTQLGSTLTRSTVAVANGTFAVSLDFGSQFPGANRFLEVRVRSSGQPGITTLAPRQQVNSAPYSVKTLTADTATNATNATSATNATNATTAATASNALSLGGVAAGQYVLTGDARLSDARNPLPNSPSYIQNQNAGAQAASNFNISGDGTAGGTLSGNAVNAVTQYNIGGNRVLGNAGSDNFFAGVGAGILNTGIVNSFVGRSAGSSNTTGGANSFFGTLAGFSNTGGNNNSFFGRSAGQNSTGSDNSFFGQSAGISNTGGANSFFGRSAGTSNTSGNSNSFFGRNAGNTNTSGSDNTVIGSNTDVASGALTNATAIGNGAIVDASNKVRIGNTAVTVIQGQVAFTFSSDKSLKENFLAVNGRDVLRKIRGFNMTSWNYIGQDARAFRHYGPMAQEFYSAFGKDEFGTSGTPTTINSGDMAGVMLAAIKELSTENETQQTEIRSQQSQIEAQDARIKSLELQVEAFKTLVCSQNPSAEVCRHRN